jgi:uncharacterized membrane protein
MHPIHPMLVHFPIALLSAAVFFDLLGRKWRTEECRIASLYTLVLGFAGAALSVVSGTMAEDAAEHSGVPERAIEIHEMLGFAAFWVFAGLLGLRLVTWLGWIHEQRMVALLLGIVGVVLMLVASYYGGSLVYDYGAGVTGYPTRTP